MPAYNVIEAAVFLQGMGAVLSKNYVFLRQSRQKKYGFDCSVVRF